MEAELLGGFCMCKINKDKIKREFIQKYKEKFGEDLEKSNNQQKYEALGSVIKSYISEDALETNRRYNETKEKQVY